MISWNIDRGQQLPTIENELVRIHPDLCLLQEVDWGTKRTNGADVAEELARFLHLNMAYGTEFEELSQQIDSRPAYIGQTTLTRLPIKRIRVLRFRRQSGFWKPHSWLPSSLPLMQRRAGGRLALITDLTYGNRPLVVYNLHLESRSPGSIQMEQLNEVLSDLQGYPPGTPAIIGGDLNSKYFPSMFLKRMEQAGFRSVTGQRIERSHAIAMALDWIFVRGSFDVTEGSVNRDFKGSDHYPVVALIGP